jgi:hypothetical protein
MITGELIFQIFPMAFKIFHCGVGFFGFSPDIWESGASGMESQDAGVSLAV